MSWDDILRLTNALASLVCLALLVSAALAQYPSWNFKTQQHWWALTGWVFLCLESSFETLILNTPAGPRLILTSLVLAWTMRALLIRDRLESDPAIRKKSKWE